MLFRILFFLTALSCLAESPWTYPIAGVWKLNVNRSTYKVGLSPKRSIQTFTKAGEWYTATYEVTAADGRAKKTSYRFKLDGKENKMLNDTATIAIKLTGDRTAESISKSNGASTKVKTVISADGKTRTQFFNYGNILVFEKQ